MNVAAQRRSSFRDADLFSAATAAAPVEQREAGGEREGQPAMTQKYDNENFHKCVTSTATTPFYGKTRTVNGNTV